MHNDHTPREGCRRLYKPWSWHRQSKAVLFDVRLSSSMLTGPATLCVKRDLYRGLHTRGKRNLRIDTCAMLGASTSPLTLACRLRGSPICGRARPIDILRGKCTPLDGLSIGFEIVSRRAHAHQVVQAQVPSVQHNDERRFRYSRVRGGRARSD